MPEMLDENVEFRGKQQMDYQQALLMHICRISQVSAFLPKALGGGEGISVEFTISLLREATADSMLLSCRVLEALLIPYADEEYKNEVDSVIKNGQKMHKEENRSDKAVTEWIAIGMLKALTRLMARKNLLLEERETVEI